MCIFLGLGSGVPTPSANAQRQGLQGAVLPQGLSESFQFYRICLYDLQKESYRICLYDFYDFFIEVVSRNLQTSNYNFRRLLEHPLASPPKGIVLDNSTTDAGLAQVAPSPAADAVVAQEEAPWVAELV